MHKISTENLAYSGNIFLLQVVLVAQLRVLVGNEVGRSTCQNRLHVFRYVYVLPHELHADYPVSETVHERALNNQAIIHSIHFLSASMPLPKIQSVV